MSPSIISGPGKKCGPDMLWLMCQNIRKVGTSPRIAGAANISSAEMGVRPGQARIDSQMSQYTFVQKIDFLIFSKFCSVRVSTSVLVSIFIFIVNSERVHVLEYIHCKSARSISSVNVDWSPPSNQPN